MRHLISLTSLIALLAASELRAQLIYISDPYVRTMYNFWVPGCVDVDGYLDASLPAVAAYDNADFSEFTNVGNITIEGLEAFTSLQNFSINTAGDVVFQSLPPSLGTLSLWWVGDVSWPVLPATLKGLLITGSPAQLPALPEGLEDLALREMSSLTSIDPLPTTLLRLRVELVPNITELPPLPIGLKDLRLGGGDMTFPDLTGINLTHLELDQMSYTSLPALPASLDYLSLTYLWGLPSLLFPTGIDTLQIGGLSSFIQLDLPPALTVLYIREWVNQDVTLLPSLPATLQELQLFASPALALPSLPESLAKLWLVSGSAVTCLPPLPEGLQQLLLDQTTITCLPNIPWGCNIDMGMIPTVCSTLSSICEVADPNVEGQVYWDVDLDGVQDVGELGSALVQMQVAPIGLAGGVPVSGHFAMRLPTGDYTITCTPSSPLVQSIAPSSHPVSLVDETTTDVGNDFGLELIPGTDLAVHISTDVARPGFNNAVWINVRNLGTQVADAAVSYTFDADQTWLGADITPTSLVDNTATWTLPSMVMGESRTIHVTLHTAPSVPTGTSIDQIANIDPPVGDIDAGNDSFTHHSEVIGSYDPNDKTVSPSVINASELATTELTYTIRFQNTGTHHAERVIITDTLSASLDRNSFRFVASSHTCNWTLYNGVLRFTFEPIYLPDSTSDEPGSHGFVTFTMKPDPAAGLGPIGNIANIYFDYNAPVITNEAIVDISTAVLANERPDVRLFPVPAQEVLWIERATSETALGTVMDPQVRTVLSGAVNGSLARLDVGALPSGAYILELRSDGIERIPFVKQ